MSLTKSVELGIIASRLALAVAIIYLAYQLGQLVNSLPEIDRSLARVTEQVPSTLTTIEKSRTELEALRKLVPLILDETQAIRAQVPPILDEVGRVRQSMPPVLDEIAATRLQLPSLLERVDKTVAVVDQTQRQIPRILETTDHATKTIDKTRTDIATLTPQVLSEISLTREMVDPTLDRIDGIVSDVYIKAQQTVTTAQGAGQDASEGAIQGVVTGILKLPFRLLGSLLSPFMADIDPNIAEKLTQKDIELMGDAGDRLAKSGRLNQAQRWKNSQSGNEGTITVERRLQINGAECVEVRITLAFADQSTIDEMESFCRNQNGNWELAPVAANRN